METTCGISYITTCRELIINYLEKKIEDSWDKHCVKYQDLSRSCGNPGLVKPGNYGVRMVYLFQMTAANKYSIEV